MVRLPPLQIEYRQTYIPRREVAWGGGDVAAEEGRYLPLGCQATEVCSTVPQKQKHNTQIPTVQEIGLGQLCGKTRSGWTWALRDDF